MNTPKNDIVNAYRPARARLKLGGYERYLAERLAVRVARLLEKRDEAEPAGDDLGDVPGAGGKTVSPSALPSRTREQPTRLRQRRLRWYVITGSEQT